MWLCISNYEFSYQQGVPGGPAGLDHIRTSASSAVAGSNRSLGLPSGQGATAPLESNSGKMLPVDVLCKNCRKEANFMCSACKSVHYCSIDCQVKLKNQVCTVICTALTPLDAGGGGGTLCVQMDFTRTFEANAKCNNINHV